MERRTKKLHGRIYLLRLFRKIHRTTGLLLFVFIMLVATTGLLLGWKKHTGGIILEKTHQGTSSDLGQWLSIDSLHHIACSVLHDSVANTLSAELERIDIRKQKGIVKFVFAKHYWGIQLDGATGKVLQIERRRADLIEKIHDGSILDMLLGLKNENIKLIYTSVLGSSLLLFCITGCWLWYGPKEIRKLKSAGIRSENKKSS